MSDLRKPPDPPRPPEPPFVPPPPPPCPKEIAEVDLRPYLSILRECISAGWAGWDRFGEIAPTLRLPLGKRSRASYIYDHIVAAATKRFASIPRVRIADNRGFLELLVGGRYVIRFKKLNRRRLSSNIPTRQQIEWFSVQLELPGMPADAVRLIVGYQVNLLGTEIADILVTRPLGGKVAWAFSISDAGDITNVVPFPTEVGEPKSARPRSTMPKKGEKKDDKDPRD